VVGTMTPNACQESRSLKESIDLSSAPSYAIGLDAARRCDGRSGNPADRVQPSDSKRLYEAPMILCQIYPFPEFTSRKFGY
jgi:hypothetical protein